MIEVVKYNLKKKAELKIGDAEFMPWKDNSFNIIICNASFYYYLNPEKLLLEMKRVLEEKGTLIIGAPTVPLILRVGINLFCKKSNDGDYRICSEIEIKEPLIRCGFKPFNFKKINYKSFAINVYVEKQNMK